MECFCHTWTPKNVIAFTSVEFAEFMKRNGIRHGRTSSYHPSTKFNSLSERAFKEGYIKKRAIMLDLLNVS